MWTWITIGGLALYALGWSHALRHAATVDGENRVVAREGQ